MFEDLSAFFSIACGDAEAVTVGGVTAAAIFDTYTDTAGLVSDVLAAVPSLLLPAASVPAAAEGQVAVVRGATYHVRQVLPEPPDGVLVRLILVKG